MKPNQALRHSLPTALAATACVAGFLATSGGGTLAAADKAQRASFKGQTLTVFATGPYGTYAQQYKEYYGYLSSVFDKATGAKLQWQYYTTPSQEVSTIETSAISGSGPDVFGYGTSFVGTVMATGDFHLLTTKDWAALGGKRAFLPATLYDAGEGPGGRPVTNPAKAIGIPYSTYPYVLAYNTKYFSEAGITAPPKTWTQFVQDAQKIQKAIPGVYGTGIDPADPFDPWKNIWLYTHALGGHFVSPNGKTTLLASPQVQAAVSFYFSLYYKFHIVPQQALTWDDGELGSAFTSGKIAMFPIGSVSLLGAAKGTPLQGHLAFAPLPTLPYGLVHLPKGGAAVETMTTGGLWAIAKYAASKLPLALDFARITVSPAAQVKAYDLFGYMPVTYAGVKALERVVPSTKPFIEAAITAEPTSISPVWSYVEPGIGTAVKNIGAHLALSGRWSPSYETQQLLTAQKAANAHI